MLYCLGIEVDISISEKNVIVKPFVPSATSLESRIFEDFRGEFF